MRAKSFLLHAMASSLHHVCSRHYSHVYPLVPAVTNGQFLNLSFIQNPVDQHGEARIVTADAFTNRTSVTVCLRKRNSKVTNDVIYQSSSGQVIMKTNEAYAETRASDSNYTDDMYAYATQPTTAVLTSNAAYNVHTSTDVVPTSSAARIPTSSNDAYGVTCSIAISTNEAYGITCKAKEAVSHDGADIPAESVPTSVNLAYGTAICQNTDDTYDYI